MYLGFCIFLYVSFPSDKMLIKKEKDRTPPAPTTAWNSRCTSEPTLPAFTFATTGEPLCLVRSVRHTLPPVEDMLTRSLLHKDITLECLPSHSHLFLLARSFPSLQTWYHFSHFEDNILLTFNDCTFFSPPPGLKQNSKGLSILVSNIFLDLF